MQIEAPVAPAIGRWLPAQSPLTFTVSASSASCGPLPRAFQPFLVRTSSPGAPLLGAVDLGIDLARGTLARLALAAERTRLPLPQVRLLDDPQVADGDGLSVLSARDDVPNAVPLDVPHRWRC